MSDKAYLILLQQDSNFIVKNAHRDTVLGARRQFPVHEFVNTAAEVGQSLSRQGEAVGETGIVEVADMNKLQQAAGNRPGVECHTSSPAVSSCEDPRNFRLTAVETLLGNPDKSKEKLGWEPSTSLEDMVAEMPREDLALIMRDAVCNALGFKTVNHNESLAWTKIHLFI